MPTMRKGIESIVMMLTKKAFVVSPPWDATASLQDCQAKASGAAAASRNAAASQARGRSLIVGILSQPAFQPVRWSMT